MNLLQEIQYKSEKVSLFIRNNVIKRLIKKNEILDSFERRESSICPICSNKTSLFGAVTYYDTFRQKWRTSIKEFEMLVDKKYRNAIFNYWFCPSCDFTFTDNNIPDLIDKVESQEIFLKAVSGYLNDTNFQVNINDLERIKNNPVENSVEMSYQFFLKKIESIIPKESKNKIIVDVGSNLGTFAQLLNLNFFDSIVKGVEINPFYIQKSKNRYPDLEIETKPLTSTKSAFQADLIYCSDVIEHIWMFESFVQALYNNTAPGGQVIIITPNINCINARISGINWWGFLAPHHCQLFSVKSLSELGKKTNFSIMEGGEIGDECYIILKK